MYGLQVFNKKHNKELSNLKPEQDIISSFDKKLDDLKCELIRHLNDEKRDTESEKLDKECEKRDEECVPFISSPYGIKHNYCNHINGKINSLEIDVTSSLINYIGDRMIFPYGTLILNNSIDEINFNVEKLDGTIEARTSRFLTSHNKIKVFITPLADIKRIFI